MLESLKIEAKARVGILGGSFNPPHFGHVGISQKALELLPIDYVIWLVAPQNPLKSDAELKPFAERFAMCKRMLKGHPNIVVSDFEKLSKVDDNITFNTLKNLKAANPSANYIWLMGADNLVHFHEWGNWQKIIKMMPIAVLDRDNYIPQLKSCPASNNFKDFEIITNKIDDINPGEVKFLAIENFDISSTLIRQNNMQPNNTSNHLKQIIIGTLEDDKAEQIEMIDLAGKADFADYMIVASGRSNRHLSSMAENIRQKLKHDHGIAAHVSSNSSSDSGWVAVDAFDIIVHLFKPEVREKYSLENMWQMEFDN